MKFINENLSNWLKVDQKRKFKIVHVSEDKFALELIGPDRAGQMMLYSYTIDENAEVTLPVINFVIENIIIEWLNGAKLQK